MPFSTQADLTHSITQPPHILLRKLLAGHQVFNPSVQRRYGSGIGRRRKVMRFGGVRRVNLHIVVHLENKGRDWTGVSVVWLG